MNPQPAWRRREFLRAVGGAGCLGALARGAGAAVATPTPIRRPAGYFALQPGDPAVLQPGNTRIVADRLLQLPQVAGLTIRARWSWIHPSEGKVELGFLEGQADRCRRLAKSYKLLVMTGAECSPSWLGGAWHARAPVPWSAELRAHYGTLVEQLGRRFSDDPLCVGVHMTGPTHPSAEMHPAPGIETVPGYSSDAMIEAWKSSIDAYAAAFPHTAA
ncbi:MAG TPA: hypothetical protein VEQ85_06835, partial [Lacipirellulaceae bacterium]|nr:hypothetical protein [Lacipirellulaceae bacterium]